MQHDVFISYSHKLKVLVDKIVSELEHNKVKCWYAPRDVIGDYATSIVDAIEKAKIFVVILDGESSNSVHVLNEVEIAYKRIVEEDANLIIMPFKINNEALSKAMEYYVRRMHWIDASSSSIDNAINELIVKIKTIINPTDQSFKIDESKREANSFYETTNDDEFKRLRLQQKFLHQFDGDVYKKCLVNVKDAKILDIGTSDGTYIKQIVDEFDNVSKVIGVDYNESAIARAKSVIKDERFIFEKLNVDDPQFESNLNQIIESQSIESFDLINVSMVLLHIKYPEKLLKVLRHFLKPNGYIVIKDVDDALKVAYPDPDGLFERCKLLSFYDKYGGFRATARQVPYFLHKAGYKDISMENCLIDTIGKDYDEKEGFFNFVIPYIRDDYRDLYKDNPTNEGYKESYQWMENNLQKMYDMFMEDGFYFSFGIMLFIAKR